MPPVPKVSVVIAAYNAAPLIVRTLASVRAQTYPNLEIVVVDDGSQDETAAVVEAVSGGSVPIVLHRQANQGVASARNLAIEKSQGDYVAPIDADDIWHPRKIERQMQRMLASGCTTGLVYTWSINLDSQGNFVSTYPRWAYKGSVYEPLLRTNFVGNASVPLIDRRAIEQVGGYDDQLRAQGGQGCEDWDLSLRIADRFPFDVVPAYLVGYRIAAGSMSTNEDSMARSYGLMIAASRRTHPDLSEYSYRASMASFYLYLAEVCRRSGNSKRMLVWIARVLKNAPTGLLYPPTLMVALKKSEEVFRRGFGSWLGSDLHPWLRLKRRLGVADREDETLAELIRMGPMENDSLSRGVPDGLRRKE